MDKKNKELPRVTIAIPTYNRSGLLKETIISALSQEYKNIEVLILDNASTDDTESVVKSFADDRIQYLAAERNIGMINNWNRAMQFRSNPYLVVLQDDDILLPGFVNEVINKIEEYPNAGFGFSAIKFIDVHGTPGESQDVALLPHETVVDGFDYLHAAISPKGLFIHSSAVIFRTSALKKIGIFDSAHDKHSFAFNLHIRIASKFDVVAIHKELVHVRLHEGQDTEQNWRTNSGTGPLGILAERIDALAYLLASPSAKEDTYREWIRKRLSTLNAQQSAIAHSLLPNMYWGWQERLETAFKEINAAIPEFQSLILIDDDQWGIGGAILGRKAMPFPSRNGIYWGSPLNDSAAIQELDHHTQMGIHFLVIGWPSFWWLEHYTSFNNYLEEKAEKIYESSRLKIYRLVLNGINSITNQY